MENQNFREKISELLDQIDNDYVLEYIYYVISSFISHLK